MSENVKLFYVTQSIAGYLCLYYSGHGYISKTEIKWKFWITILKEKRGSFQCSSAYSFGDSILTIPNLLKEYSGSKI